MTLPMTETVNSSEGEVAYVVLGDGPPIVLVHGTPGNAQLWQRVAPRLAEDWRVHVYDLPGYGRSAKFEGQDVRLRTQAAVLGELVDHWALERPLLVGHDFGAATVLGAHLVEQVPATGLMILDGVVLNPWGTDFSLLVRDNLEVFRRLPGYVHEALVAAHLRTATARPLAPEALEGYLAPWRGSEGQAAYYRQIAQFDHDYTARLERLYPGVRVPTRILWGAEDGWVDPQVGARLAELIPAAELELLADASHFAPEDLPTTVAHEIAGFARRIGGAATVAA